MSEGFKAFFYFWVFYATALILVACFIWGGFIGWMGVRFCVASGLIIAGSIYERRYL